MIATLAEAALRSLVLGGVVWFGLTLFRVRNPHVHMTAWVVVLVASLGVGLPLVAALILGERSREPLDELKDWLGQNNAVIMAILLLVIGTKLVGDAISGF